MENTKKMLKNALENAFKIHQKAPYKPLKGLRKNVKNQEKQKQMLKHSLKHAFKMP